MSKLYELTQSSLCDESFDVGIEEAWFYESSDVDMANTTVDATTQTIDGFALKTGKNLVKVAFDTDVAFLQQEHSEGKRSRVTQTLSTFIEGITSPKRLVLKSYKDCRCLQALVMDSNGRVWAVGCQVVGGELKFKQKTNGAGTTNTQTNLADEDSGFQRSFVWTVKDDAIEVVAKGTEATVSAYLDSLSASASSM